MRSPRLLAALAASAVLALPVGVSAQEEPEEYADEASLVLEEETSETPAGSGMSDADLDRLADKLADKVADRLAERLGDRLEAALKDRAAAEPLAPVDPNSDEGVRRRIASLIERAEPEGRRDAFLNYVNTQWPEGEPLEDHAAGLAGAMAFLGQQLPKEVAYDAFGLAGEIATMALEAGDVPADAKRSFGMVFYLAACDAALQKEYDAALADLDRAFEYGFNNLDLLKEDEDLKAVRERPDFAARLEGWERAAREAALSEAKADLASGQSFPLTFTFTDTDGEEHSLADYKGEVVIVDFWGTWCGPCVKEIPSFIKLQKAHEKDGLQILGLNYGDEPEQIAQFVEANGMNYPTGLGDEATQGMVPEFRGFPTTVFVGRDGKVRMTAVGAHEYAYLDAVVSQLLDEPAPKNDAAANDADADAAEDEPGGVTVRRPDGDD